MESLFGAADHADFDHSCRTFVMATTRSTTAPSRATLVACFTAVALGGCTFMAVQTAPAKLASTDRTALAKQADGLFWQTLHSGNYDGIARALEVQTAAYLQNPNDAVTAARAGWLHIWRLAESTRMPSRPATITNDAVMARKYFEEAVKLNPAEARYSGFLGAAMLAEAHIHKDQKLQRAGYFQLRDSITAWPEFNLFTAGYVMSGQPAVSERFVEGLEWQWQTLDLCVGEKVDRQAPDFKRYMAQATTEGVKRVCWNSTIAPHNFEGFFMNMGDMLVKAGQWQVAQTVYANARHSPSYAQWPFKAQLEQRERSAQANVLAFNAVGDNTARINSTPMMNGSNYSCMACHQR